MEVLAQSRVGCGGRSELEAGGHLLILECLEARGLGCSGLLVESVALQAVSVDFGGAQSECVRTRGDGASRRRGRRGLWDARQGSSPHGRGGAPPRAVRHVCWGGAKKNQRDVADLLLCRC